MAKALGISTQAFRRFGVEPVARVGRGAFVSFREALDNRVEHELKKVSKAAALEGELGRKLK